MDLQYVGKALDAHLLGLKARAQVGLARILHVEGYAAMAAKHTHPKDCPDNKEAAADRKVHDAVAKKREDRQQVLAHAEWLDWFPTTARR